MSTAPVNGKVQERTFSPARPPISWGGPIPGWTSECERSQFMTPRALWCNHSERLGATGGLRWTLLQT
jgi:hypothetical protein